MVIFSLSGGRWRSSETLVGIVKPSLKHLVGWYMDGMKGYARPWMGAVHRVFSRPAGLAGIANAGRGDTYQTLRPRTPKPVSKSSSDAMFPRDWHHRLSRGRRHPGKRPGHGGARK